MSQLGCISSASTDKMCWSQVRTRLAPMPCKSHGIALVELRSADSEDGSMAPTAVLFGGMPSRSADMTSDVYTLSLGPCACGDTYDFLVELATDDKLI